MQLKSFFLTTIAVLIPFATTVQADEAAIAAGLKQKGAVVVEANGVVTSVTIANCAHCTDDDYQAIGKLAQLKMLSLSQGFRGPALKWLAGLTQLENFSSNVMEFNDDDMQGFAALKGLKSLAFFHPGKEFKGAGLAHLESLPKLTRLTVAGSFSFGDEGLVAIGRLKQLEELRIWHAGQTNAGLKHLADLPKLKRLTLGQRLTYQLPASPDAQSIALIARCKSLESLQLDEARLSGRDLQPLLDLPQLKTLNLAGIEISEADLTELRRQNPKLDLRWTEPSAAYVRRIKALFDGK